MPSSGRKEPLGRRTLRRGMLPRSQQNGNGGRVLVVGRSAPDPPPAIASADVLYLADVATSANHSLTGLTTLDGVTLVDGVTRVLVRVNTTGAQNGLYTPHAGAWERVVSSTASYMVQVLGGTALGRSLWLTADGSTFVNPYASILPGTITNAHVNAAAAIAYSKLALTGSIVAADIATGAVGPTQLASTAVTAGSYTNMSATVDADGRLTGASSGFPGVDPSTFVIMAGIQNNGYLQLKTRPSAEITNFTITAADCIIEVDTSGFAPVGGKFIGTLPQANAVNSAANPLRWFLYVSDVGGAAGAKPIRLVTQGADTINGAVTTGVDMASNGGAFIVTSNGVSKFTIQKLTGA